MKARFKQQFSAIKRLYLLPKEQEDSPIQPVTPRQWTDRWIKRFCSITGYSRAEGMSVFYAGNYITEGDWIDEVPEDSAEEEASLHMQGE